MELLKIDEIVSVEEYLSGELVSEMKHEYLGGIVHAMAGGKLRHSKAAGNVYYQLRSELEGKTCQPFNSDTMVRIELPEQTRFYYPDAMVVCDSLDDDSVYQDKPVVVIEVFSESTKRVDLGEKRAAYRAVSTLRVLILVDPERPYVTVDRRRENGGFETEFFTGLDQVIALSEVSAELRMSDIYAGIDV